MACLQDVDMIVDPRCKALIDLCYELGQRARMHPEATEQMIEKVIAQFTKMESVEGEADWEGAFCAWSSLLDAIEKANNRGKKKQVAKLIAGRFDLVEQYGFRVEFTGMPASGGDH